MKTKRKSYYGIHINAEQKVIKPFVFNSDTDTLHMLYNLIGCTLVQVVSMDKDIDLWVDEEGLLSSEFYVTQFDFNNERHRYAGNVVILKTDWKTGNTTGFENLEELEEFGGKITNLNFVKYDRERQPS